MKNKPTVSVIITTKNEQDVIENLLASIKKQNYSIFFVPIIIALIILLFWVEKNA